jgi:Dual specificity phosphatase, catalytic domain
MNEPALNLDWIDAQLAVGGSFPARHAERLARELGISRIVDVRGECCDDQEELRRHGMVLLHLPTEDRCAVAQEMLDQGVRWVGAELDQGCKVYIHCEHGIGRSALLALCVLVSRGLSPLEALRVAKRARWKVSPSPEQLEAFRTWVQRHGIEAPPLQELFEIAYAHLRSGEVGTGTAAG